MPRGGSERDSSLQRSLDALTQTLKEHKNVVEADTKARTGTSLGGGGGSGGGGGGGGKSFLESLGLSKDPAKAAVEFGQSALSRVSQVVASNPLASAGVDAASAALSGAKAGPLGAVIGGVTSFGTSLAQDFFAQRERSSQAAKGGYLSAPLGVSDEVAQRYGKHAEGQELLTNDSLGNRLADIEDDALSFFGIEGYGGREGRLKGAREDQQKFHE